MTSVNLHVQCNDYEQFAGLKQNSWTSIPKSFPLLASPDNTWLIQFLRPKTSVYTFTPHFQYFLHLIHQTVLVSIFNVYNWNHYFLSPASLLPYFLRLLITLQWLDGLSSSLGSSFQLLFCENPFSPHQPKLLLKAQSISQHFSA